MVKWSSSQMVKGVQIVETVQVVKDVEIVEVVNSPHRVKFTE